LPKKYQKDNYNLAQEGTIMLHHPSHEIDTSVPTEIGSCVHCDFIMWPHAWLDKNPHDSPQFRPCPQNTNTFTIIMPKKET
jgi:hypothetical protein